MKYILENQETVRLRFRLLEENDFDQWMPLFAAENAALFLGMDPSLDQTTLCRKWFDKINNRYKEDLGGMNVLIDKETNQFIGQCGLLIQTIEEKEYMEIGYSILPKFWGQGYATEAAQKCKEYAFEAQFTDQLISVVHVDNIGSANVAQKNGMTILKSLPNYEGIPVNIYGLSRKDWLLSKV